MYVIVLGNLAKMIGPFATNDEAAAYAERFDMFSDAYDPGRWKDYTVQIIRVDRP